MDKAQIFWSGRSQAVRLPENYRLEGSEVHIRRDGNFLILEPITESWDWLDTVKGPVDPDFVDAALDQPFEQDRPRLDDVFK